MAFQNLKFPDIKLKHGISKSILDPVIITGNGAREVRRRQNKFERSVWNFPSRTLLTSDQQEIYNFLREVNMSQDSFLMRDPLNPTFDGPLKRSYSTIWFLTVPLSSTEPGTKSASSPNLSDYEFYDAKGKIYSATYLSTDSSTGLVVVNVVGTSSSSLKLFVRGKNYCKVRFQGTLSYTIQAMKPGASGDCGDVTPTVVELDSFSLMEVL